MITMKIRITLNTHGTTSSSGSDAFLSLLTYLNLMVMKMNTKYTLTMANALARGYLS